jgi:hypothetical protein
MPYPKNTPYDILELSPSASTNQIMKAYQAAIRKRKFSAQKCQQAFTDLRNPRKRLEIDLLLLCGVGNPDELKDFFASLPSHHFIPMQEITFPIIPVVLSIMRRHYSQDFIDLPENPFFFPDEKLEPEMVNFLPDVQVPL